MIGGKFVVKHRSAVEQFPPSRKSPPLAEMWAHSRYDDGTRGVDILAGAGVEYSPYDVDQRGCQLTKRGVPGRPVG